MCSEKPCSGSLSCKASGGLPANLSGPIRLCARSDDNGTRHFDGRLAYLGLGSPLPMCVNASGRQMLPCAWRGSVADPAHEEQQISRQPAPLWDLQLCRLRLSCTGTARAA